MAVGSVWLSRPRPTQADPRDHEAWQLANELTWRVWAATGELVEGPDAWVLRDRARGSARLVASSIAKGFERAELGQQARFLAVARASVEETRQHLRQAMEHGALPSAEFDLLWDLSGRTAAAIGAMIDTIRGAASAVALDHRRQRADDATAESSAPYHAHVTAFRTS